MATEIINQRTLGIELEEKLNGEIKSNGYKVKNHQLYRINGNVFQSIGIDRSSLYTHIRLVILPFWCNYYACMRPQRFYYHNCIDIDRSNRWMWNGLDLLSVNPHKHLDSEIDYLRDVIMPMLNTVWDEKTYVRFLEEDTDFGIFTNPYAVLWESYKQGSSKYARDWLKRLIGNSKRSSAQSAGKNYQFLKNPPPDAKNISINWMKLSKEECDILMDPEKRLVHFSHEFKVAPQTMALFIENADLSFEQQFSNCISDEALKVFQSEPFDFEQIKKLHDTAVEEVKPFFKERFKIDVI